MIKPQPSVADLWGRNAGADVYVVGTGTSLADFDWRQLVGRVTIGLNDAVKYFPPTYHLFSDHPIWPRYERLALDPSTSAVCCHDDSALDFQTSPHCSFKDRVRTWTRVGDPKEALVADDQLFLGHTVATAGIQMAWKLGARRIFLLGIDACSNVHATYADGSRQDVRDKVLNTQEDLVFLAKHKIWCKEMHELKLCFDWRGLYRDTWPGSGVFNLSDISRIDAFAHLDKPSVNLH